MTLDSKPSAKPSTLHTFWSIVYEVIQYQGLRVIPIALGLILNNLLRGVSILLLIPGVMLLRPPEDRSNQHESWLNQFFSVLHIEISLIQILLSIVVLIITATLIEYMIMVKVNQYQADMKQHVRQRLFDKITQMPWQDFSQYNTAELMRLVDSEINQFARSVNNKFKLIVNSLHMLAYVIAATFIHWKITAAMLVTGGTLLAIGMYFNKRVARHANLVNVSRAAIYETSLDILHNFKFAKVQGLETQMQDDFGKVTQRETDHNKQVFRTTASTSALSKVLSVVALSIFIWGSVSIFKLPIESLLVILFIAVRILTFTTMLQRNWQLMISGIPSFHNISNILRNTDNISELLAPHQIQLKQAIHLRNIYYEHPHHSNTVEDINLSIPANQITVIIGRSGSGKTTIVDLIAGILSPNSGEILVDDTLLNQQTRRSWSHEISYLPQDTPVFSGTVRDNFKYSHRRVSDEEIWDALTQCKINHTIAQMPHQLDTLLGTQGRRLSGGEKQRLALARAISAKPSLLILDEPTSSQDYINEQGIQASLNQLKEKMTILIIAHKRNIIRHADHIVVVGNGKIVAQGDHSILQDLADFEHLI